MAQRSIWINRRVNNKLEAKSAENAYAEEEQETKIKSVSGK